MIRLTNVEKSYATKAGETFVLRRIGLEIAAGESRTKRASQTVEGVFANSRATKWPNGWFSLVAVQGFEPRTQRI